MLEKGFNTGEINLNYVESGSGGSPLLLIHGTFANWKGFGPLISELEQDFNVFAVDLRGHGKSDRAKSYRIRDFACDIAAFIKNCLKQPAILFGHSFGGMTGIMVAACYPDLVKGLVIGDSLASMNSLKSFANAVKNKTIWWRELARLNSVAEIIAELKNELIQVPGQQDLIPAYKVFGENHPSFYGFAECFSQCDHDVFTANIENIDESYSGYDTDNLFPLIKCPVLILQANPELGGLLNDADVKKAMTLLQNVQHIKIPNAGHYLHMQSQETVLNAMMPFMKSLS